MSSNQSVGFKYDQQNNQAINVLVADLKTDFDARSTRLTGKKLADGDYEYRLVVRRTGCKDIEFSLKSDRPWNIMNQSKIWQDSDLNYLRCAPSQIDRLDKSLPLDVLLQNEMVYVKANEARLVGQRNNKNVCDSFEVFCLTTVFNCPLDTAGKIGLHPLKEQAKRLSWLVMHSIATIKALSRQVENTKVDPENNIGNVDRLRYHLCCLYMSLTIVFEFESF